MMSGVSKPYSELYSPVRNDEHKLHLRLRFALKIFALKNWLKTQPRNFFSDGIKKKLVKRWDWYVEVEGDYVET
jgi:hypothetical protein